MDKQIPSYDNMYGFEQDAIIDLQYRTNLEKRMKRWDTLNLDSLLLLNTIKSKKLKRFITKGVPANKRDCVWFITSGAYLVYNKNPTYYNDLVNLAKTGCLGEDIENEFCLIDKDLNRTLPENSFFTNKKLDLSMRNVIRNIVITKNNNTTRIKYNQCFSYITATLLLFMNEERCYWTLNRLVFKIMPKNIYDLKSNVQILETQVVMSLLHQTQYDLYSYLVKKEKEGMPSTLMAITHWIILGFADLLPIETMLRVWDILMYLGYKTIVRCCLALFVTNKKELMAIKDPLKLFVFVKDMPKRVSDPQGFVNAMMKWPANVSNKDIDKHRQNITKLNISL